MQGFTLWGFNPHVLVASSDDLVCSGGTASDNERRRTGSDAPRHPGYNPGMPEAPPKIGIVSLGCPKALVDSERILSKLRAEGYELSGEYDGADLGVVNTCGFLDTAKAESLEAIGEAMQKRSCDRDRLSRRGGRPYLGEPSGVLAVTGPHKYEAVVGAVHEALPPPHDPFQELVPPEGINNAPALCLPEDFRGLQQSL